jgi:hypothetical protein
VHPDEWEPGLGVIDGLRRDLPTLRRVAGDTLLVGELAPMWIVVTRSTILELDRLVTASFVALAARSS